MTASYYLDGPTLAESTSHDWRTRTVEARVYGIVIRRRDCPGGWVFRFRESDSRGAHETLANLNWGIRVVRVAA